MFEYNILEVRNHVMFCFLQEKGLCQEVKKEIIDFKMLKYSYMLCKIHVYGVAVYFFFTVDIKVIRYNLKSPRSSFFAVTKSICLFFGRMEKE